MTPSSLPADPPPPRRKWHFNRWLIVLIIAMFGWSGWRAYAFRSALSQAKALGWAVENTDPVETIRENWKAAFKKATWLDGVTRMVIPTGEAFEQHLTIVHRLNPKGLKIDNAPTLRDLSALKPLSRLQAVWLNGCTGLTNVDGLKNLSDLQLVYLFGCTGLTNVDALKNLSALKTARLIGCTGLTEESVVALRAALPKANIYGPKQPMTTDTPSRRKWHFNHWFIVFMVATLGWSGWRAYAFRSALSQAKALGWRVEYTDPFEEIRQNWKAAFRKATWLDDVTYVLIPTSEEFEQRLTIVHRLNPKGLDISNAPTLRDLSGLQRLTRLQGFVLRKATGLTNVDGLKNLSALKRVSLDGCTGLTKESVAALKAALPKAQIYGP